MGKNFKCQTFHELSRKSIFFRRMGWGGGGENFKVTKHQVLKYLGNAVRPNKNNCLFLVTKKLKKIRVGRDFFK